MDRVPYRRIMPSRRDGTRNNYAQHDQNEITPGETVIMQCIISGILMVAVLIICLVEIAPATSLREGLRQALSGANTVEELLADVRNFGEEWLDWTAQPAPVLTEFPTSYYYENPPVLLPPATSPEYYYPLTAAPESSNPQSPGPSVVPGLWD